MRVSNTLEPLDVSNETLIISKGISTFLNKHFKSNPFYIIILSELTHNIYGTIPSVLRESSDRQCIVCYGYPDHKGWKFCALGTLAHKAGENPLKIMLGLHDRNKVYAKYGVDRKTSQKIYVKCPECGGKSKTLGLIAHLNDSHDDLKWGEIADKLENVKLYDMTQPRINQFIDTMKIVFAPESDFSKSLFEKIEKRFRK